MSIRGSKNEDFSLIHEVINDGACAYRDVIPADCWHEPYMSKEELLQEIDNGIEFWISDSPKEINGVMGIQDKIDVCLIRHAYVRTNAQRDGVGSELLKHIEKLTEKPILIGTWAAASWAIQFYQKHRYQLIEKSETPDLLDKYWGVPKRQVETSVILAHARWFASIST